MSRQNIAYSDQPVAATMPIDTSVSMVEVPWRARPDRRLVERPGRPGDHRSGQGDEQPLPIREPHRGTSEKTIDRSQSGTKRMPPRPGAVRGSGPVGRPPVRSLARQRGDPRARRCTLPLRSLRQVAQLEPHRMHDPGALGCKVDARSHAVHAVQASFDPSSAGTAGHPTNDDGHFGCGR